jgi:hypothetical protein
MIWEPANVQPRQPLHFQEQRKGDPRMLGRRISQQSESQTREPGLPTLNAHKRGAGRERRGLVPAPAVPPGGLEAAANKQRAPARGGISAPLKSGTRGRGRPAFAASAPRGENDQALRARPPPRVTVSRAQRGPRMYSSARHQPPTLRRRPGTDLHLGSPSPETILSLRGGGQRGKEGEARPGREGGRRADGQGKGGRKQSRAGTARAAELARGPRSRDLPANSREILGPAKQRKSGAEPAGRRVSAQPLLFSRAGGGGAEPWEVSNFDNGTP